MKLTSRVNVGFELCFKYPLAKGFTSRELTKQNLKVLQAFLDKVSKMTVQQVYEFFSRVPDKNDKFKDCQVLDYALSDKFRIHVVLESGNYKVLRLDTQHKFHAKNEL